jgi:hypothetical protein
MVKSFKELIKNQESLREKLFLVFKKEITTYQLLADNIGVNLRTLRKFLIDGEDVEHIALLKILNYIEKKEQEK